MSPEVQHYLTTLLVFGAVAIIASWGLDIQFGDAGILNFAFILSQAAGAYTAALLTLGPPETGGGITLVQEYFWGASVPFPLHLPAAMLVGALVAVPIGFISFRKLRSDYQAIAMLAVSLIATTIMTTSPHLLGGALGLHSIEQPWRRSLGLDKDQYAWFFVGICAVCVAFAGWVVTRISRSPLRRMLCATRDNEAAAAALGTNVLLLRLATFAVGNALGALSGALLVLFLGAYSTSDWVYGETFVLLAAVIIGGAGNRFGVVLGALLLPVGLSEGVRYLPSFGAPGTKESLQMAAVGVLIIAFMWLRPRGIVPERRRRFDELGRTRSVWSRRPHGDDVAGPPAFAEADTAGAEVTVTS